MTSDSEAFAKDVAEEMVDEDGAVSASGSSDDEEKADSKDAEIETEEAVASENSEEESDAASSEKISFGVTEFAKETNVTEDEAFSGGDIEPCSVLADELSLLSVNAKEESATYSLTLKYDDRYALSDFTKADLSGYSVSDITTDSVTSYQVSKGEKTSNSDTAVVKKDGSKALIAVGVGTATVTLYNSATENEVVLSVTVKPATLTMIFIAGQSNAEGTSSSVTGSHPEDSVVCPEGEVYSTYAPSSDSRAHKNTGISGLSVCTSDNAESFVAGSLTGTTSLNGSKLTYPLNSLTESGKGKTGMDAGLSYEWNKLTGDKVWVVNAAWSSTGIKKWIPGGSAYQRALAVYKDALKTEKAEISAGHYTMGNTLLFWLQGEADTTMSASDYISNYKKMYNGFQSEGLGIEYHGIIIVRSSTGSYTTSDELYMTGPRTAQYLMGNSTDYPGIYVVSNVNEQWISDSGVKSYFKSAYGSKLSYPLRSNTTLSGLPATVKKVHGDIHYAQVGHNENGITAAKNMYYIVKGGGKSSSSVSWYDQDGNVMSSGKVSALLLNSKSTYVPVASNLYHSKEIKVSVNASNFSYSTSNGTVKTSSSGTGTLKAKLGSNSASITIATNLPVVKSVTTNGSGVKVKWSSVSGATGYRLFRKTEGGKWKQVCTTTSTSYTDKTTFSNGETYYYTVRAYKGSEKKALANTYSSKYWSSYDSAGYRFTYMSAPKLKSSTTNTKSGIEVKWSKVSGVSGYAIYRKKSGGSWKRIGTTTSTSYTDKTAKAGTTYYYTVRAYQGKESKALDNTFDARYWSGYQSSGVKGRFMKAPKVSSAKKVSSGVKVSWKKVSDASGYVVFRKTAGGSWKKIGTTTSTSYTDKSASKGKTYYYTVRAYSGNQSKALKNCYKSQYWSGYDSKGVSAKR